MIRGALKSLREKIKEKTDAEADRIIARVKPKNKKIKVVKKNKTNSRKK